MSLGVYLHIPFCRSKCPYCDFFSTPGTADQANAYVDLLLRQLELTDDDWSGPVGTVFFGGGTPSLLEPADIARLLDAIDHRFGLTPEAEISLEGNPDSLDAVKLTGYHAAGVNRLSIGLQSLDDRCLRLLQRPHDAAGGLRTVQRARRSGFTNISCDLMFNLPGQDATDLTADLDRLLELTPEHIAVYGLTIEAGTPFAAQQAQKQLQLPDEDRYVAAYQQLHAHLSGAGYEHYEISNFARPGYRCEHNLAYWHRRPYLGLGAGAHSFSAAGYGSRLAVPDDLAAYAADLDAGRNPLQQLEIFDRQSAMAETLYLGLRTAAGVDDKAFNARFGVSVAAAFPRAISRCAPSLHTLHDSWRLDLDGWLLFNTLLQHFF